MQILLDNLKRHGPVFNGSNKSTSGLLLGLDPPGLLGQGGSTFRFLLERQLCVPHCVPNGWLRLNSCLDLTIHWIVTWPKAFGDSAGECVLR